MTINEFNAQFDDLQKKIDIVNGRRKMLWDLVQDRTIDNIMFFKYDDKYAAEWLSLVNEQETLIRDYYGRKETH